MDTAINDVLERFKQQSHLEYGESVTQLQHALQTAVLAEGAEASDTLMLQGGPYTSAESDAFANLPFAKEAVQLRQWDDCGKVPNISLPPIEYFIPSLEASLR